LISNNPKLLQEIRSSMKINTSAQEEGASPWTVSGNWLQIKFCKY
jgi:hypothetical protein